MLTLKLSDLRPVSKTNPIPSTHTKAKSINHHTKTSRFRSAHIPFQPPAKKHATTDQVHSIPTQKSRQFRRLDIETKCFSIQTLKPSIFRPPQINQVYSDPDAEIKSSSIPHTQIKSISTNQEEC